MAPARGHGHGTASVTVTRRAAAVTVTVPPGPGRDAPPYKALPPLAPTKWGPRDASDLPQCIIISEIWLPLILFGPFLLRTKDQQLLYNWLFARTP